MSLYLLATGMLISDPARRTGAKGADFATATIRVATDDGAILISAIAFGELAAQLLAQHRGDALAVSGRARLSEWTGRAGETHHGISLVVEQLASASAARRAGAARRQPETSSWSHHQ